MPPVRVPGLAVEVVPCPVCGEPVERRMSALMRHLGRHDNRELRRRLFEEAPEQAIMAIALEIMLALIGIVALLYLIFG